MFDHAEREIPLRADEFTEFVFSFHHDQTQETGLWRSPIGIVALFIATRDMISSYVSFAGDPWASMDKNLPVGVYIVHRGLEGGNSLLYYGTDLPGNMAAAQMDFDEADRAFEQWAGAQGL